MREQCEYYSGDNTSLSSLAPGPKASTQNTQNKQVKSTAKRHNCKLAVN
jgi:hypothetical protein